MNYAAVILAAGKGVRMNSELPKVAHRVAGKPLVAHVAGAVREAGIEDITMVVGHGREVIEKIFAGDDQIKFVVQAQQLGTGHALMQAEQAVDPHCNLLVLAGDTPLLQASTIKQLTEYHRQGNYGATLLSTEVSNPYGYGRVLRNPDDTFARVVEEKDASADEKSIKEINSGMYCFQAGEVFRALADISSDNAQGEYYLTEVLEVLQRQGQKIGICLSPVEEDIYGINDRVQLAQAEALLRQRKNIALMKSGVTLADPNSIFIDSAVQIGHDTIILPFTMIEGDTVIGERCEIGPGTRINDSNIGNDVIIEYSRVKQARVGDKCTIGPYSYLRPEAHLLEGVKVGDFVEVKKSTIGKNSKIPHLSYVGDAMVGSAVNIGAGTITCNYDGKNKYPTILEDGVFIGSNTNLVAPVTIGSNSITGAGSTITRDVPPQSLAVERAPQKIITRKGRS